MMARYVLRRLVYLVIILALLTVLIFGITQALPGNVARMILGSYNAPETLRALEESSASTIRWRSSTGAG